MARDELTGFAFLLFLPPVEFCSTDTASDQHSDFAKRDSTKPSFYKGVQGHHRAPRRLDRDVHVSHFIGESTILRH
ncbi:hypothetical protein L208DRAFT_1400933 [Tricholoma matsutake]|nr:hypothetical protein L208DRAFT_1400933 [Tricholoma matsutake 945]